MLVPRRIAALLVVVSAASGSAGILLAPEGYVAIGLGLAFFGLGLGVALAWAESAGGPGARAGFFGVGLVAALVAFGGGAALDDERPAPPIAFVGNDQAFAAIDAARLAHRPVVLDFGAGWCWPTFRFDGVTKGHDAVRRASRDFVMIHVDASDDEVPVVQRLLSAYRVRGVPEIVVLDGEGREAARLDTYVDDPRIVLGAMRSATTR